MLFFMQMAKPKYGTKTYHSKVPKVPSSVLNVSSIVKSSLLLKEQFFNFLFGLQKVNIRLKYGIQILSKSVKIHISMTGQSQFLINSKFYYSKTNIS